jgi:hypothetical protein
LIVEAGRKADDELSRLLDDTIESLTDLVDRAPSIWHFRATLAEARGLRARFHEMAGRRYDALVDAKAAEGIFTPLVERGANARHRSDLAMVFDTLGRLALAQSDRESAERAFASAIDQQMRALEAAPENTVFRERLVRHQDGKERSRQSAP